MLIPVFPLLFWIYAYCKNNGSFEENDEEVENRNGEGSCDISFHIDKVKKLQCFSKFFMFITKNFGLIIFKSFSKGFNFSFIIFAFSLSVTDQVLSTSVPF